MSYGRYRRFAILLPPERLTVVDPGLAWFEAATMMPLGACSPVKYRFVDLILPSIANAKAVQAL